MPISNRVNKIGFSPTMRVAAEAREMQMRGIDVIDLTVGEPDFPTPQNIKDAAIKAINNNFTKYTNNVGILELRQAIACKLQKENGVSYSADEIIVSSGAKQSIYNAIQALVSQDDEVIFSSPYYVSYPEMVLLAHGKNVIIPTTEENGFKITPQQLKNYLSDKTKLLILCNPCNPTGTVYTKEELKALFDVIEGTRVYVLSDEIYEKLVYDDFPFFSFAGLNEKAKEKTVTINGHSKSFSMTGWRLGYAAGSKEIISAMSKYQSHSTGNASSISQAAALEALIGQQDSVESARKEFERRRNYLHKELISIDGLNCYKPDGAFYLFPNVEKFFHKKSDVLKVENSFDFSIFLLHKAKVATVAGSAFGAEGYIRISYSTSMEKLEEGIKRIKEALCDLK